MFVHVWRGELGTRHQLETPVCSRRGGTGTTQHLISLVAAHAEQCLQHFKAMLFYSYNVSLVFKVSTTGCRVHAGRAPVQITYSNSPSQTTDSNSPLIIWIKSKFWIISQYPQNFFHAALYDTFRLFPFLALEYEVSVCHFWATGRRPLAPGWSRQDYQGILALSLN